MGDNIVIDDEDDFAILGYTDSTDFPVTDGAFQDETAGESDPFDSHTHLVCRN